MAVSSIANIETQKIDVFNSNFQYDFDKYIYSEEPRCMFIVTFIENNVEMVGYAALDLMMFGKFQKRVAINYS